MRSAWLKAFPATLAGTAQLHTVQECSTSLMPAGDRASCCQVLLLLGHCGCSQETTMLKDNATRVAVAVALIADHCCRFAQIRARKLA